MHRSYLYPHNPTFGALSQGRARFFCEKAGAALLFQHKLCWARELRSNTPCPGSTFSCTDCLVHTNRAGGSPLTDGGFFAEPQRGGDSPSADGGSGAAPAAGAKRKDNLRFSFLFELLPFPYSLVWRRLPTCDRFEIRGTAEDFFYRRGAQCAPMSRHIRSVRYRSATHAVSSTQWAA